MDAGSHDPVSDALAVARASVETLHARCCAVMSHAQADAQAQDHRTSAA